MSQTSTLESKAHPQRTARTDNWWLNPLMVATGFTLFIAYATFRAFENNFYEVNQFLSPFYSPKLLFDWWKFSPAILILWIPAGFRATCYYYRKAYYRAYFMTPPACGVVGTKGKGYCGETKFPFILQNMHRYFFYLAALVLAILWWDAIQSTISPAGKFTFSLLSLVMFTNCFLLSDIHSVAMLTAICAAARLTASPIAESSKRRLKVWQFVTHLNEHHMGWAWASLFSVGLTDFYVRQVASGALSPVTFF